MPQLTLVAPFKKHLETGSPYGNETREEYNSKMDFYEFMDAIKEGKIVNEDLARETSHFHNKILDDKMRYGGDPFFNAEVAKIIQKAFKLGLVGKNEELIAKYEQSI